MSTSTFVLLNNRWFLALLCVGLIYMTGCDSSTPIDEDDGASPAVTLPALPAEGFSQSGEVDLRVNLFQMSLDSTGELDNGRWQPDGVDFDTTYTGVFSSGLWIARSGPEPEANIVWVGTLPRSNYTEVLDGEPRGVYYLTPGGVDDAAATWPVGYGAPVDGSGNPVVYGDAMAWTALTSRPVPEVSQLADPLSDLRVTQALYGFRRQDALRDVVFVRYEITNTGTARWDDVYVGVHADNDLALRNCRCVHAGFNNTAYDEARSLTYTYTGDQGIACLEEDVCSPMAPGAVLGFTFLETPDNTGVLSHRIMRKNNYINPGFGEYGVQGPQQVLYALRGLSNEGQPMVNPVTGETTMFAFTGDPVAGTGWLDESVDVRSLLTAGSFSLNPGETKALVGAYVFAHGKTRGEGVASLQSKVDLVRNSPQHWRF